MPLRSAVSRCQHAKYADEFKEDAIKLVTKQRLSRTQGARDLGTDLQMLRRWLHQQVPEQGTAKAASSDQAELARQRRENALLCMERDILKNARCKQPYRRRAFAARRSESHVCCARPAWWHESSGERHAPRKVVTTSPSRPICGRGSSRQMRQTRCGWPILRIYQQGKAGCI